MILLWEAINHSCRALNGVQVNPSLNQGMASRSHTINNCCMEFCTLALISLFDLLCQTYASENRLFICLDLHDTNTSFKPIYIKINRYLPPSQYLNQWWLINNRTDGNNTLWSSNPNIDIFIHHVSITQSLYQKRKWPYVNYFPVDFVTLAFILPWVFRMHVSVLQQ